MTVTLFPAHGLARCHLSRHYGATMTSSEFGHLYAATFPLMGMLVKGTLSMKFDQSYDRITNYSKGCICNNSTIQIYHNGMC